MPVMKSYCSKFTRNFEVFASDSQTDIIRVVRRQRRSPGGNNHSIAAKVKVYKKVGKTSRSRSQCKKRWYHMKGLVTMNTLVQYESATSSGLKVMAKVKVFSKVGQTSRSEIMVPRERSCHKEHTC